MNVCNNQYWIIFENNFGKLYLILILEFQESVYLFTIQTNKYKVIINTNGSLDNQFST